MAAGLRNAALSGAGLTRRGRRPPALWSLSPPPLHVDKGAATLPVEVKGRGGWPALSDACGASFMRRCPAGPGLLLVAAAAVVTLAGCGAGRALQMPACAGPASSQRIADALILDGCYECLVEARDAYERQSPGCGSIDLMARLFETQLLVVVRERELAIDDAASTAAAERFAAHLPTSANADRYLRIAAAVGPDAEGLGHAQVPLASEVSIRADIAWLTRSPSMSVLDEYLSVALACELPSTALPDANAATVPLLQYRQAHCGSAVNVPAMQQVRERVPRFDEASFLVARALFAAGSGFDHREITRLLALARERFPGSASIAYQLAVAAGASEQWGLAKRYHSDTLRLRSDHQGARLGRAVALSHLGRFQEAIDDASLVIESGASRSGEAQYWRAWNHHRAQSLVAARTDIDNAKKSHRTPATLLLAALIELDQSDFGLAHDDLQEALRSSPAFCQARWQLGVVDFRRQDFPASADAFAAAAVCYEDSQASAQRSLETVMARTDLDGAAHAQRVSALQAEARELERGRDSSVLNAALNYARAGNRERAQLHLHRAGPNAPRDVVAEVARALAVEERPASAPHQAPR